MRRSPSAEEKAYTLVSVEDARGTRKTLTTLIWAGPALKSHRSLENKLSDDGRVKRRERMLNFSPSDHLILKRLVMHLDC